MKKWNKLPMALTILGVGAASSFGEIKINDNLSTAGFVDMSASGVAKDTGDATLGGELDQYELDFFYKFGFFSARADVNGETAKSPNITLEQAFVTASLLPTLSLGFGKFLSTSGFEAAEPTGLYQFSVSKSMDGCATGGIECVYGGYQNGINIAYTGAMFGVYAAAVTDVFVGTETEYLNTPGFEGQVSLTPIPGLTAKGTFLWQTYDSPTDDNQGLANVWAQFATGPITVAGEFNYLLSWTGGTDNDLTGMSWLAMANFKFTDKFASTLRYSAFTLDDEVDATDDLGSEVTVSPSFAISPNWLALAELRFDFGNYEATSYAVENTFSF